MGRKDCHAKLEGVPPNSFETQSAVAGFPSTESSGDETAPFERLSPQSDGCHFCSKCVFFQSKEWLEME